jgi:hypothetical protein
VPPLQLYAGANIALAQPLSLRHPQTCHRADAHGQRPSLKNTLSFIPHLILFSLFFLFLSYLLFLLLVILVILNFIFLHNVFILFVLLIITRLLIFIFIFRGALLQQ